MIIHGKHVLLINPELPDIGVTDAELEEFSQSRVTLAICQQIAKHHRRLLNQSCAPETSPELRTHLSGQMCGMGKIAEALKSLSGANRETSSKTEAAENALRKQLLGDEA